MLAMASKVSQLDYGALQMKNNIWMLRGAMKCGPQGPLVPFLQGVQIQAA